jgi:hypothetical protein
MGSWGEGKACELLLRGKLREAAPDPVLSWRCMRMEELEGVGWRVRFCRGVGGGWEE